MTQQGVREIELAALRAAHQAKTERTVVLLAFMPDGCFVYQPVSPELLVDSANEDSTASMLVRPWLYARWEQKYHPKSGQDYPGSFNDPKVRAELDLMAKGE